MTNVLPQLIFKHALVSMYIVLRAHSIVDLYGFFVDVQIAQSHNEDIQNVKDTLNSLCNLTWTNQD
jgi:hypothetical protein